MIDPKNAIEQVKDVFAPLIGQVVWQVRRGHGSFLTMEFGKPHLVVREPIVPSQSGSDRVQRILRRRHVDVTGDWHLWIEYGGWGISTANGVLTSDDPAGSPSDECIRDLEGQRLVSVVAGRRGHSCAFGFDLGGKLEIWPSAEITEDQWSLYSWHGDIVAFSNDGDLVVEQADPTQRVFKPLA